MIASRYAPHLVVLFLVALIPTVIHVYIGMDEDDGLSTSAIPEQLAGFTSQPTERRPAWGRATFDSYDWFERVYEKGKKKVRLFVGRSYNQKRLYHHPEIALSRGTDLAEVRRVKLPGDPEMTVHLLPFRNGTGMAAYLLIYDGVAIADPVANQLRNAVWQLFNPRRPMTLFYVVEEDVPPGRSFAGTEAALLLRAAVSAFLGSPQRSN